MTRHSCKLASKVDVCCNLSIKNFYFSHLKFKKKTNITILCLRNCDLYFYLGGGVVPFCSLLICHVSVYSVLCFCLLLGFFFGGGVVLGFGFSFCFNIQTS